MTFIPWRFLGTAIVEDQGPRNVVVGAGRSRDGTPFLATCVAGRLEPLNGTPAGAKILALPRLLAAARAVVTDALAVAADQRVSMVADAKLAELVCALRDAGE